MLRFTPRLLRGGTFATALPVSTRALSSANQTSMLLNGARTFRTQSAQIPSQLSRGKGLWGVAAIGFTSALMYTTLTSGSILNETAEEEGDYIQGEWPSISRCMGLGSNAHGLLGEHAVKDGPTRQAVPISFLDGKPLRSMSLSESHGAAVDANGDLIQWGKGHWVEEDEGTRGLDEAIYTYSITPRGDLVSVGTSQDKVYGLSKDGRVFVIAASRKQQQLDGHVSQDTSAAPTQSWGQWIRGVKKVDTSSFREVCLETPMKGERVRQLAVGQHHVLALTTHGRVFSCPADAFGNRFGQLGRGDILPVGKEGEDGTAAFATRFSLIPEQGADVEEVACGYAHSISRTKDGRAWAWGANGWGQLGQGDYSEGLLTLASPTEIRRLKDRVVRVVAGGLNSLFLTISPTAYQPEYALWACGMGQWGTLGNGTYGHMQGVPVKIKALSHLKEYSEAKKQVVPILPKKLHLGYHHAATTLDVSVDSDADKGVTYGTDLLLWGHNMNGECGNGKKNNLATPVYAQRIAELGGIQGSSRLQLAPPRRVGEYQVEGAIALGKGVTIFYDQIIPSTS
ncbi:MAG: regulator of chromosome condensation 1/beta-lactamase-inhibitor protein II [Piptocephalis tieghemiana]|nr:MAG: regulator of chromosome condensation 1/beta-lactamase-inhibitor protein II [Piptocephalis tieghemiana]